MSGLCFLNMLMTASKRNTEPPYIPQVQVKIYLHLTVGFEIKQAVQNTDGLALVLLNLVL
jgi:hypothetical protein